MPDVFTKEKRSEIMSKIRSKGTNIERKLKAALEESNITFEYQPKLFGKPDFLISPNLVVFCDSSFWHGRNWKRLKPRLKEGYWREHISKNRERDVAVNKFLAQKGYIVLRFWDNEIIDDVEKCLEKIQAAKKGNNSTD